MITLAITGYITGLLVDCSAVSNHDQTATSDFSLI